MLTYHRFAYRRHDPFALAPAAFEAQMASIAGGRRAIGLDQLIARLDGCDLPLPDHPVLVTIDDGAASTLEIAAPILDRYRIPAIAFVTASRIGRRLHGEPECFLDAEALVSLMRHGVEIGSHAVDHVSLGRLSSHDLGHQTDGSKQQLQALLGCRVRTFAYPFGTRRDFSPVTRRAVSEAGYDACFTSQHGSIRRGSDPLTLPRIKIEGGDPERVFEAATRGGLDGWIVVDRALAGLQASQPSNI